MATSLELRRTYILKVRFNRSELDQFARLSGDRPLASYARRLLLNQPISPGTKQPRKTSRISPTNDAVVRQIAYIGNNLNQIARSLNIHLKIHPEQALNTLVAAHMLQLIWERLDDVQTV